MYDEWGDNTIQYDEYGQPEPHIRTRDGRVIPYQVSPNSKPGEFTTYPTANGHCAFCGCLTCNGQCFK